ncbi:hypothetical protein KAR91_48375 [Candidatus Pacearchaeota archaeon]|nr:hypothetical protein [Candidatus Pacearchaeota archaeon]
MSAPTTIDELLTRIDEELGVQPETRELIEALANLTGIIEDAIQGDMVLDISPTTVATAPTASAWTRDVVLTLQNAAGETHEWCDMAITTRLSIADASSAGTATIVSTTLTFVNGVATIVVSGDAQAWLGGTAQVETITCTAGESTGAGDITMTITAAGMSNSPKAVVVAISADDDTVEEVGALVRAALALDADVSAFFTVSGAGAAVVLTAITPAADDGTLAFGFVDTDTTGVTFGASTNTTAGVAKETDTLTVANLTIMGYTVTGGTSVETFTA